MLATRQYSCVRPTLALVGGTHGAGKSTLAALLSPRLNWTLISRDLVRGGMARTEGEAEHVAAGDLSKRAVSVFYDTTCSLLTHGASLVVESAFRRGISETDLAPLIGLADLRYVHCVVPRELAIQRCRERPGREFVGAMLDERDEVRWSRVEQPLDLGASPLIVETADGYRPGLDEIEAFVRGKGT